MLKDVQVVGAGGKMGRGIALILLQVMAQSKLILPEEPFTLKLVDTDKKALSALPSFLREHLRKFAEKKINLLRKLTPDLVSNDSVINHFIEQGMDSVWLSSNPVAADLTFEAIIEDIEAKAALFNQLNSSLILSNTSSIPIHILQEKSKCPVIGFHFYNPPHIQSLVELVTTPEHREQVLQLVTALGKTGVEASDVAGFIGNGHFMREINEACRLVEEIGGPLPQAIYLVNKITGDFLLRPMGIFELIDYVGLDVCKNIAAIMSQYLKPLDPRLLREKQGTFFQYEQMVPVSVMGVPIASIAKECDEKLGPFPPGFSPWKQLLKDPQKREKVQVYLQSLSQQNSWGAQQAQRFLNHSEQIARDLVKDKVARSLEDVSTVLKLGFHHLYGVA